MSDYKYDTKKHDNGEVEVDVDVTKDLFQKYTDEAFEHIKDTVKIPGFRAGKAPRSAIESKLGIKLIEHALEDLVSALGAEIVNKENWQPLTRLEYKLGEMGEDGGIKFSFTFTNYPDVKLGDFTKIKVQQDKTTVTDEEVNNVLVSFFTERYNEQHKEEAKSDAKASTDAEKSDAATDKADDKESKAAKILAWIDDEQVKALGYKDVHTLVELRKAITDQIQVAKERESEEKFHSQILEEAIKLSQFIVPQKLIDEDSKRREEEYLARIKELGIDMDSFLAAQNTSIADLQKNWQTEAKTKFSNEIVLGEIAKKYELIPAAADIQKEIDSIQDPKVRNDFDSAAGRRYVASILIQQRGMRKLLEIAGVKSDPETKAESK